MKPGLITQQWTGSSTLVPPAPETPPVLPSVLEFNSQVRVESAQDGAHVLRGLRIFKEGTFKNSMGEEGTWESIHLDQMILHFHHLKDHGLLPDVPLRVDHSYSVESVVGYFLDIYRDKEDPTFLSADVEITEPDAYEKWKRRTFRARSLEVGAYETNDGSLFWPVVRGLAFVDIPAVEGLHAKSDDRTPMSFSHFITDQENITMADKPAPESKLPADSTPPPAPEVKPEVVEHSAPAPTPPAPTPPAAAPQTFRVGGVEVSDYAAVQRHIEALEQFQRETADSLRDDFVMELAEANKIAATQVDGLQEHCRSLTTEQFEAFRALYEGDAPPATGPVATAGIGGGSPDATERDQFEVARETVAQHQRAGMKPDKIKNTSSYKTLVRLAEKFNESVPVLD